MFEKIPVSGDAIGNQTLRKELGWDEQKYWDVRKKLLDEQRIGLGRGRGGAVYRVLEEDISEQESPQLVVPSQYQDEANLYRPFEVNIRERYIPDLGLERAVLQLTAGQGRRATGGTWTRPDLTLISVDVFNYVPEKSLTIITFELKKPDAFDVPGVLEATAHTRFSNKSYLVGYLPDGRETDVYRRVYAECERFGIGLVTFSDPEDYSTYNFEIEPDRTVPDPSVQNEFIETQINEENKRRILTFLR